MLVRISASPDALRGPEYMQRAFAAMHQANQQRLPFTLEYGRLTGTVSLFLRFPPQLRPYIETPLVANYPDIAIERVGEDVLDPPPEHGQWSVTARLRPDLFPIKRPEECEESDPIAGLLATLAAGNNDPTVSRWRLRVQSLPSRCARVWMSKHLVRVLDRPLFRSHDLLANALSGGLLTVRPELTERSPGRYASRSVAGDLRSSGVARSGDRPKRGSREVARSGDRPQRGVSRPATTGVEPWPGRVPQCAVTIWTRARRPPATPVRGGEDGDAEIDVAA